MFTAVKDARLNKERKVTTAVPFSPGLAVDRLLRHYPKHLTFIKPWMLIELLSWMVLDQQPGHRLKHANASMQARPTRRKETVRRAHDVGIYALGLLWD